MKLLLIVALLVASLSADALPRSRAVRADFQRSHPCPTTGAPRGACPGWQVDHVLPLKCGGADRVANLQWLTVHDHALKTAREAHLCRKARSAAAPM